MPSILNATTTNGLVTSADNSGSLQLQTNNGTTAVTIDTSQNVGIGTSSPTSKLHVKDGTVSIENSSGYGVIEMGGSSGAFIDMKNPFSDDFDLRVQTDGSTAFLITAGSIPLTFQTNSTERMRIDSSGNLLVGVTSTANRDTTAGIYIGSNVIQSNRSGAATADFGRLTNDGDIVVFRQDGTAEGSISVSGTTISYNGGHLSRWAQTIGMKDESLVKGTVLSNLDEMNEYVDAEGNPVDNEQLNKVKVSDVEGDVNVAGVFVNWSHDEAHNVDEINMAMTGDMIIRIAQGVVVQKGDLLMSAGDGTAKPQGDDIVRSKTIAKVTSNHVTCTYADGSYCVPCVLMAC